MYNIAIDGPAGAGKRTIAKKAAKKHDFFIFLKENKSVRRD